jgi:DNA-binding LacI/PurR family transcriptional regulator
MRTIAVARLAVGTWIARRRRTIAHISGPLVMCAGIDRLDGYRDAFRRRSSATGGSRRGRNFDEESGYTAATLLLSGPAA